MVDKKNFDYGAGRQEEKRKTIKKNYGCSEGGEVEGW